MIPKGAHRLVLSVVFLVNWMFAANAFAAAEISVVRESDGVAIPNGGTFGFGLGPPNVPDYQRFRIHNTGNTNLVISNPTTLVSGAGFSMIANPVGTVQAGQSTTFRVQFVASAPGDYHGAITIQSNDADENPYVISLYGGVTAPEIAVFQNWNDVPLPDGGSFAFPDVVAGDPDSRRFRITNTGTAPLNLGNPTTLVSGPCFSQIETPTTPIAAGASAWFRVRIFCHTPGTYTGTVSIQSNDADENPYDITVTGRVVAPVPEIAVFRDWDNVAVPDGGSFTFPDPVVAGVPDSRRFRITNTGNGPLNLGNAATIVSGTCFHLIETPVTPIAAGASAWFRVRIHCNTPGTYTGAVSIQSDDADENPYDFTVSGTVVPAPPEVPEIDLYRHWDNVAVPDDGSYAWPNPVPPGQAEPRTFRIENSGTAALTIANPSSLVSGTCFSQTGAPPASSIAPGASTTFTVQVQCNTAGTYTGAITIQNNDGSENPYGVSLQAVVGTPADFNVSVTPSSLRVRRGTSGTATVTVTAASGTSPTVALSAASLPNGITASFQPASIRPGQSSRLTIQAANSGPFGDFTIRVKGISGGVTREATASLRVADPNVVPTISAIQPETIPVGQASTVTLTGTNFHNSQVTVGNTTDRAFPTVNVVSVSADGRQMVLQVDATDPAVLHHYALYVKNSHGEDGISVRVVPDGPVVDYWSPSEAAGGTLYAMDVVGVNLQGATVLAPGGGVSVFDVDNAEDDFLSAFLKVEGGAGGGPIDLTIRGRNGGDTSIRVDIREQRNEVLAKTTAMTDSTGEPLYYVQELKRADHLAPPDMAKSGTRVQSDFDFEICAEWGRSRSRGRVWSRTWFKDPLTGEWGPFGDALLDNLRIGDIRLLQTRTFTRWFFFEFSLHFRVCYSDDSGFDWDVEACVAGSAGFHIPIVGGLALEFGACFGSPSTFEIDLTGTGLLSFIQFHRRGSTGQPEPLQCVRIEDQDPLSLSGERTFEVELLGCCAEEVGVGWGGEFYIGSLQVNSQHAGTARPGQGGTKPCLELRFRTTIRPDATFMTVDPFSVPNARIGVLAGDTLVFRGEPQLGPAHYSWSGALTGIGQEREVRLPQGGNEEVRLTALGTTRTARIAVYAEPPPPTQFWWADQHPWEAIQVFRMKDEAEVWAASMFLGEPDDHGGGRRNAALHAYWVCLMTKELGADLARGASTAHERTNLEEGAPHAAIVMDLENNATAIGLAGQLANRNQCGPAVFSALNAGELTILSNPGNFHHPGLLIPSNRPAANAVWIDHAPVANDDSFSVFKNETLTITQAQAVANDTDADGHTISVHSVGAATNGTARKLENGSIEYQPAWNFVGTDSFEYTVADSSGAQGTGRINITVMQDLPPVPGFTASCVGFACTFDASASTDDRGILSYQWVMGNGQTAAGKTFNYSYTAAGSYSVRLTVQDTLGQPAETTKTVVITCPSNQAPQPRSEVLAAPEDTSVGYSAWNVLSNDVDPDGDTLRIVSIEQPQHGAFLVSPDNNQFSYRSHENWYGMDSFYYTVSDPCGAQVRVLSQISVSSVNDSPVANNDSFNVYKNQLLTITQAQVVANDTDVEGHTISVYSVGAATKGTTKKLENGSIEYQPYGEFVGTDSFEYIVSDSGGNAYGTGRINITVLQDTPPVPSFTVSCVDLACTFDASASTDDRGIVSYQWLLGNNQAASGKTFTYSYPVTGTYSVRLTVQDVLGQSAATTKTVVVTCPLPAISAQPASRTINSGQSTTLSVTANGTSYQWYQGTAPSTASPVGTNGSTLTVTLGATASYWVKVTNSCGSTNSTTATVTVCALPGIATQPASQTIASGHPATLSVAASGSGPFSYQWYEGASGTTTTPVGTNSSSFTTPALTATKSYWVRVTSACNAGVVSSATATVTVSQAVIARRQFAATTANSQLSITKAWTQPTQAGTLLVAIVSAERSAYPIANWQPPAGWQLAASYEMTQIKTSIYYYPNNPGGRTSETFGNGGYYDDMILQLAEYTGMATVSPLDKTAFNGNTSSDGYVETGYTAQTAQPKELVITALATLAQSEFYGPSQGFVEIDDRNQGWGTLTTAVHEKVVNTAGSWGHYAQTTSTNEWIGLVVTFKGN